MNKPKAIGTCPVCEVALPVLDGRSWRRKYCSSECKNAARRAAHRPKPGRALRPLAERLWARCERKPSGCLEWQGFIHPDRGYGQMGRGGKADGLIETHRAAWEVTHGPIPDGLFVLHRCDNRACCDPEHLFLGTHQDNVADMVSKGRQAREFALPHTKLSDEQVREIRARYDPRFGPPKRGGRRSNALELAEEFGITSQYVMQLVHGRFRKGA